MYSQKFKTIFVHIPKTGGQSVEHVFLTEHGLSWEARAALLLRKTEKEERAPVRLAHLLAREYVSLGYVAKEDFAACFKFTVVRYPYDRAISEYRSKARINLARNRSFRDYVLSLDSAKFRLHDVPQSDFVLDESGKTIVDRIVRFENLAADFADVSEKIFGRAIALPHANKSAAEIPAEANDIELRRALYRIYERDFDLFKYPSGF